MKLLKFSEEHYIICDDSEIKEGDYVYSSDGWIFKRHIDNPCQTIFSIFKVTHSTEPIEFGWGQEGRDIVSKKIYNKVSRLSLPEVKELLGAVDVDKKAVNFSKRYSNHDDSQEAVYDGYNEGYKQCLIDNKEKMYTEEDVRNAISFGNNIQYTKLTLSNVEKEMMKFIQSLQPKTEWEVEIIDGKLKLK